MHRSALAALIVSALMIIPASGVIASDPAYVWGAGQVREDGNKISFGAGFSSERGGAIVVRFRNLPGTELDGSRFRSRSMTAFNWFAGDDPSCKSAMNVTFRGRLDGKGGYKLRFFAGDGADDTVRFELSKPGGAVIYDTRDAGSGFTRVSDCVGVYRTDLDRGNVTIRP